LEAFAAFKPEMIPFAVMKLDAWILAVLLLAALAPHEAAAATSAVVISGFAFAPTTLTVDAGDTVVWTNEDSSSHTATSTSGPDPFDTGTIGGGASRSVTFVTVGTYAYRCAFHTGMTGTLVVRAANQAPLVILSAPEAGPVAANVTVRGNVNDPDGLVGLQATWRLDTAAESEVELSPDGSFNFTWNSSSASNGVHVMTVTARDANGATASASRSLDVQNVAPSSTDGPPTIEITAPADGARVTAGIFLQGRTSVATDQSVPSVSWRTDSEPSRSAVVNNLGAFTIAWDTTEVADGPHDLFFVATDAQGRTASVSIRVVVDNAPPPNSLPVVTLETPHEGMIVEGPIQVSGIADDEETRVFVEVRIDDGAWTRATGPISGNPAWAYAWDPSGLVAGDHTIHARVTEEDAPPRTVESQVVHVTVRAPGATATPTPHVTLIPAMATTPAATPPSSESTSAATPGMGVMLGVFALVLVALSTRDRK
jgi:plastocyanin